MYINISIADLSIDIIFNEQNGTISFLRKTIQQNKLFKDSNIETFVLYRKIIRDHKEKIKTFSENILEVMILYIKSVNVSAKEKEMCVFIIQDLVEAKLCGNANVMDLLKSLMEILTSTSSISNLPSRCKQKYFK